MGLEDSYTVAFSLAKDFELHRHVYLAASYSESQLRTDFVNKFLTALGWDVDHAHQKNPFAQEVKVETSVSDQGAKRRADYAFYVAPNFRDPRVFVEAKKPFGELETPDNYFQAIRYGWNSHTPLVVLTNFNETHLLAGHAMSYVLVTLLLAALLGLDGPWPFVAVLVAAFLIHLCN